MSSDKRRISFVKLSERDLKDLGFSTENTQTPCESGTRSGDRRLSFVKLSQRDLKDLGWLNADSQNTENARESGNKFGGTRPRKLHNIFPPPNLKSVTSIHKTRSSTISRRSNVFKKESKKKTVARINTFLYDTLERNKNSKVTVPDKILGPVKKVEKSGARKELFKIPVSKSCNNAKKKSVHSNQNEKGQQTPLVDIDKAEILLRKKTCLRNSLFKPSTIPQPVAVPKSSILKNEAQFLSPSTSGATVENITRKNSYPDLEFEMVEKICAQERTNTEFASEITLIHEILKKDKEDFQRYNETREKRMNIIFKMLNEIQNRSQMEVSSKPNEGKEEHQLVTKNHFNTSTPTRSRKTTGSRDTVQIFSPNSSINVHDLRVNLLKTTFNNSCNKTPKDKKAQKMYDNLRKTFSLLETPQFDRTAETQNKNNISTKLQEQCLLLLETPKHN